MLSMAFGSVAILIVGPAIRVFVCYVPIHNELSNLVLHFVVSTSFPL